jgi:hypothetical protein
MNTFLVGIGIAISIIIGVLAIIFIISKTIENYEYNDFGTYLLDGMIIIFIISAVIVGCLGIYELKDDNKAEITPYYSQGHIVGGKFVSSNELLPFEDGSYVKKSEVNDFSENSDTYYIRIYINDSGDFVEQTIEGELTYSYTTDKPHIEKYLSKEKTIISDEEYSYKIYIPKTEKSTETTQSTTNTETTTDNAVENNN